MEFMTWTEWMEKFCATCRWGKSTPVGPWRWKCYSVGRKYQWMSGEFYKPDTFDCAEWEKKMEEKSRECLESIFRELLTVEIWLDETSQPIILAALNTYTRGPLFCVYTVSGRVHKFPVAHLFRVVEDYGDGDKCPA